MEIQRTNRILQFPCPPWFMPITAECGHKVVFETTCRSRPGVANQYCDSLSGSISVGNVSSNSSGVCRRQPVPPSAPFPDCCRQHRRSRRAIRSGASGCTRRGRSRPTRRRRRRQNRSTWVSPTKRLPGMYEQVNGIRRQSAISSSTSSTPPGTRPRSPGSRGLRISAHSMGNRIASGTTTPRPTIGIRRRRRSARRAQRRSRSCETPSSRAARSAARAPCARPASSRRRARTVAQVTAPRERVLRRSSDSRHRFHPEQAVQHQAGAARGDRDERRLDAARCAPSVRRVKSRMAAALGSPWTGARSKSGARHRRDPPDAAAGRIITRSNRR